MDWPQNQFGISTVPTPQWQGQNDVPLAMWDLQQTNETPIPTPKVEPEQEELKPQKTEKEKSKEEAKEQKRKKEQDEKQLKKEAEEKRKQEQRKQVCYTYT